MGSKTNPAKFDCYANALPDEPMFILLARDPFAPALVRSWANEREQRIGSGVRPIEDRAMVAEARECAEAMEKWRSENDGKWRLSDSKRLATIAEIILRIDNRCMAVDGPVTPTSDEIMEKEISEIWALCKDFIAPNLAK